MYLCQYLSDKVLCLLQTVDFFCFKLGEDILNVFTLTFIITPNLSNVCCNCCVFVGFSQILKGSGCVLKAEILTCVCISQGSPLPTIKWPLLKDFTEYSAITTVSYHTVNSSVTLNLKHHDNITVECISSNENGEAKENLIIQKVLLEKKGTCCWL